MHARTLAYLWLSAAMLTVGSTVVASKVIGQGLPPFTATALRFALALPAFALLMRLTGTPWPRPGWGDTLLLGAQALCGSVGYTVFLIAGTRLTTASEAGVIIGALPAMAALVAMLLLRERPQIRTLGAIGLATAGVLVVTVAGGDRSGASSLAGDALVLAAVACESLFILLNKRLRAPLPPLALATAMAALGLSGALPFALAELVRQPLQWTMPSLLGVTYYALVPTVAGFWLWYAGAARVSASEASLFTAIAPASGVLLSALLLGDPLSPRRLAGLALVIGAVLLQARPLRRRQPAA
jgi:drug/metabolite transporter (DMT)-like permease